MAELTLTILAARLKAAARNPPKPPPTPYAFRGRGKVSPQLAAAQRRALQDRAVREVRSEAKGKIVS